MMIKWKQKTVQESTRTMNTDLKSIKKKFKFYELFTFAVLPKQALQIFLWAALLEMLY